MTRVDTNDSLASDLLERGCIAAMGQNHRPDRYTTADDTFVAERNDRLTRSVAEVADTDRTGADDPDVNPARDGHASDATEEVSNDIVADGVELTYADGTEAVSGIDLRVHAGEVFGFLGPNGAGKTTLIKTLVTLLEPTGGSVRVNGFDPIAESRQVRRSVGYMAQETSVDEGLTARENVRFAGEAYGVPPDDDRIDDLLALADLADVADKSPRTFSGGMQKRLDVTTALVHNPPIVFLDEPTTGLDPQVRNRLWEYIRDINRQGTTVFLTTQYLAEADELCDRIAVIKAGEIVATGTPAELKREVGDTVLDIELGDDTDAPVERTKRAVADLAAFDDDPSVQPTETGISIRSQHIESHALDLLVALRDAGLDITGFTVRSPTLDDVFLAITGEPTDEQVEQQTSTSTRETEIAPPTREGSQ